MRNHVIKLPWNMAFKVICSEFKRFRSGQKLFSYCENKDDRKNDDKNNLQHFFCTKAKVTLLTIHTCFCKPSWVLYFYPNSRSGPAQFQGGHCCPGLGKYWEAVIYAVRINIFSYQPSVLYRNISENTIALCT